MCFSEYYTLLSNVTSTTTTNAISLRREIERERTALSSQLETLFLCQSFYTLEFWLTSVISNMFPRKEIL